jgi:hypothetical protein
MLRYLNIVYMDGEMEAVAITDDFGAVKVQGDCLVVSGGDGSYARRGEMRGYPLANIRRWWTSDREEV